MKTRYIAVALALAFSGAASAQNPTPGLPALPLFTAHAPKDTAAPPPRVAVAPPQATAQQTAAAATAAPVATANDAASSLALLNLVQQSALSAKSDVKPPPRDITVQAGTTETFPIALGTLNRIQTPFADPVVTHGTNIAVERQGSVLFVSSNDPTPTALFITPRGDDDQSIVLTLRPTPGLNPVAVHLHLTGYEESKTIAAPKDAAGFEASQPYVDTLKDVFRELALGHVPQGYGFTKITGSTPWMPNCRMPGISISPRQLLDGGNLVTVVARAVNTGIDTTEINEAACAAPGVLAVAAWPTVRLEPGQATELYIAVRRPDDAGATKRPSALNRGG